MTQSSSIVRAGMFFISVVLFATAIQSAHGQTATLAPTSRSFGSVVVGSWSGTRTVTLTNTGTAALSVSSITTSGDFAQTNTCGSSVAAARNCVMTITFKPTAIGARTGTLTVNDSAATQTTSLTGTGVTPITITPASHGFGSVAQGTTSLATSLTLRNGGMTAIAGLSIASINAVFAETSTCGSSLAAAASCTVSVTFSPTAAGAQTGQIRVSYTGVGSPVSASVTGTGVAPITITPASRAFGTVAIGQTSGARTFTITNHKTVALPITVASTNAEFAQTGCGSALAAGASCTASVTFTPAATATGLQTGQIQVSYTGTGSPQSVSVQGTAVAPLTALPNPVQFSMTRAIGTPSVPHDVTINNNSQSSAVAIQSIVSSPTAYAITGNTCGSSISAGNSCHVTIVFTPTVVGTTAGTLTITSGASPLVVNLTGGAQVNNLVSLVITVPNPSLLTGTTEQLKAIGTYASGTTGDVTNAAVWSSANTGVATVVSNTGVVTGVSAGTATITAAVSGTNNGTVGTVQNTASVTVTGKTLSAITLTTTQGSTTPVAPPTLAAGTNLQLYATGSYNDGSTQDITTQAAWSPNSASATVSQGLVHGVSAGTVTISAALSAKTGSTAATVTAATLQSIAISPTSIDAWSLGQKQQFRATGTYSDNSQQDVTSIVTWDTSIHTVATISNAAGSQGLATSLSQGQVVVTAAATGVTTATTSTLTVGPAALVSIAVTPANSSIPNGSTQTFSATGTYSDNTTVDLTSSVAWTATPNPSGAATFTGNSGPNAAKATTLGIVTIKATSGSINGTTQLTVTAPVLTSIAVTPTPVSIHQGVTQQFTATGTYSDATIKDVTATVAWSAGDGSVATISTSGVTAGLATGVAVGTVAVVATFTPATGPAVTSTVTGGDGNLAVIRLTAIIISPTNPSLPLGDANSANPFGKTNNTAQFTATANFADNTTADVTATATWTSSDPTVATINNTGSKGLATLVKAGPTTITATYSSVPGTTLLTVLPALLESITVAPNGVSRGLNGTQQFTATAGYSDGTSTDITNTATWTSFNPQVVAVATTGSTSPPPGMATVVAATNIAVAITATSGNVQPFGSTNTAFVSALSSLPISCPTPTIDMKLLVVNNAEANLGAGYADFPAIQQILNYVGTPYSVVDAMSATLPPLSDGICHGFYQGIIYAFGNDIYNNPSLNAALTSYEQTFKVRRLNWYTNPAPDFGLNFSSAQVPATGTDSGTFTAAAAPIFFYANPNTPVAISNAFIFLTTPTTPSGGGTVTPLLVDPAGNTLSAITNFSDGRQYLSQMFDSNPFLMHDLRLAYGLLNWVTKGVFLGDYHVYASQQIDDFFIDDAEWVPGTSCTNPVTHDRNPPDLATLPNFRLTAADMAPLVTWQNATQADPLLSNFKLTIAFNGVGTVGNNTWTGLAMPGITNIAAISATNPNGVVDDLVYNFSTYQQYFHWISHTFDHPNSLNPLHKSDPSGDPDTPKIDSIDLEILTNLYVAGDPNGLQMDPDPSDTTPPPGATGGVNPLTFTDFNPGNLVSPGVTGLNDPVVPTYLSADGIKYVVTDTSVIGQPNNGPNPSPNVGIVNSFAPGIYEVPRYANDIFYNAATWADDQAEFHCIYGPTPGPAQPPYDGYVAKDILNFVSDSFVVNMLKGDMNPEMFHQPNLHFSDNAANLGLTGSHISSLLTDTYDQTFAKYKALYNLPILSPTLDQTAVLMQNRNSYNLSGVTASMVGVGSATPQISITMPSTTTIPTAVIPVTGLTSTGSTVYGGQNISHINMTPGQTITFPWQ